MRMRMNLSEDDWGNHMSTVFGYARAALALVVALTGMVPATPSQAIDARHHLPAKAVVSAPAGAIGLCNQYDWACSRSVTPVEFPADALQTLRRVNQFANRAITPVSDMAQYAVAERWALPTKRGGDCEDYALYKKYALIKQGFPPQRLLLASVLDRKMQPHAVLIVRIGPEDLVLDNLTSRIVTWDRTGYTFLRMQDPDKPERWLALLTGGALS